MEKEPKATRSGNARIHGMTQVTPGSIAYVATQVSLAFDFREHDLTESHFVFIGPFRFVIVACIF